MLAAVQELIGCLVPPEPGLDCSLAKQLIRGTGPAHAAKYMGMLHSKQCCMLQVHQEAVLAAVQELTGCLVASKPGLDCGLAGQLISRTGPAHAAKYVGVLPTLAADAQDTAGVSDLPRFAWNYLAGALNTGPAGLAKNGEGLKTHLLHSMYAKHGTAASMQDWPEEALLSLSAGTAVVSWLEGRAHCGQ